MNYALYYKELGFATKKAAAKYVKTYPSQSRRYFDVYKITEEKVIL